MGQRHAKYKRSIGKLASKFIEELITAAGLQVADTTYSPPPSGQSVHYEYTHRPGFTHQLYAMYQPPIYVNVQRYSDAYSRLIQQNQKDAFDRLEIILTAEGLVYERSNIRTILINIG